MHGRGRDSTPICLLFSGLLLRCLLLRSRRLFSSQCTTGFSAAAFCLITPFLLLASCMLAGCCPNPSASHNLESAILPSLTPSWSSPPLSMPQPLPACSNARRTLLAVGSCTPTCQPAPPHLVCPRCLLLCLLPCRFLLWCLKITQSTHSH